MQFLVGTHVDFLGHRRVAFILSAALIIAGVISLVVHGGPKYGIDFQGGTLMQVKFENPIPAEDIRAALASIGLPHAQIQRFGGDKEAIIRVGQREGEDLGAAILDALNEAYPGNPAELRRQELVGPKVGKELRTKALMAILYALIGILIYISIRFEFRFAVGAVVALIHDVAITLGMFSLTGREVTLPVIAAFLTIVGYSLNDTIVVYDRIRENRRKLYGKSFVDIVNISINETLSRTLITSATTLFVVIALYFFGGEVIHDFAFALLVGVIVGTYSSIYVASPLVVEWQIRQEARRHRRK
jgi:preprotein translocase subunit SecF